MEQLKECRAKYKPLSFDTTMRNPERIAGFLSCLVDYEGRTLTNSIIHDIIKKIIGSKIYSTMYEMGNPDYKDIFKSEDLTFTDLQLEDIIKNSPQKHKEAGFEYGWPSRFDTWYSLAKEYGFVWYKMDEPIRISQTGHMLIDAFNQTPTDNKKIQNIFLNAMCKWQPSNPFRKNLISNVPLILLLKVIDRFKKDNSDSNGIYKQEISFFLCWKDSDDETLYRYIKEFRKIHTYSQYTDEIIYNHCLGLLGYGEKDKKYVKMDKVINESVDEYIRKMKITGILSLRGNGRFLDFNMLEKEKIEYVLNTYSEYEKYTTKESYFEFMEKIDPQLFDTKEVQSKAEDMAEIRKRKLYQLAEEWSIEYVFKELLNLCNKRESKDPVLKFINAPARLEFLTSVALKQNIPHLDVEAQYAVDDEGLPTYTAGGNTPDIICHDNQTDELVEVTLMCSKNDQVNQEMLSITRHQEDAKKNNPNTFSVFVAPRVHPDALLYTEWIDFARKIKIYPYSIPEFIDNIKNYHSLEKQLIS